MHRLILLFILSFLSQGVISNSKYNLQNQNDLVATPYGERTIHTRWFGQNRTTSYYDNSVAFTGRYHDKETGLYYFRARYYDSEQGRFISRDPAGYLDGMGLYNGYFASGFTMDPYGYYSWSEFGADAAGFSIGLGKAAPNLVKGIDAIRKNPWGTVKGLYNAISNPGQTLSAIAKHIKCQSKTAEGIGELIGDFALGAASGGILVKVAKVAKLGKKLGKLKNKIKRKGGTDVIEKGVDNIVNILGKNAKTITNKAGDKVFISKDGTKRVRFDIKNSHGDKPHGHIELKKPNGKWTDFSKEKHRIYSKDK